MLYEDNEAKMKELREERTVSQEEIIHKLTKFKREVEGNKSSGNEESSEGEQRKADTEKTQ